MSTCNRLDLQALGSQPIIYAQKSPRLPFGFSYVICLTLKFEGTTRHYAHNGSGGGLLPYVGGHALGEGGGLVHATGPIMVANLDTFGVHIW